MIRRSAVLLLSSGRHPVTGRTRAADCDARALGLALGLQRHGWDICALHAGQPDDDALGQYLGMGLPAITVLGPLGMDDDAIPLLADVTRAKGPSLVLCGVAAETGEGSGMTPYLIGAALDAPVIADVTDILCEDAATLVLRAEAAGRRRQYALTTAAILAVGPLAPTPPPFAYGRMKRGAINLDNRSVQQDVERAGWAIVPRRARPARLKQAQPTTGTQGKRALTGLTPDEAAAEIITFLTEINVLRDANVAGGKVRPAGMSHANA